MRCENLRGNVQTRLGKLESGMYHGIILAAAGLKRLGLLEDPRYNFQFLECESFVPAGGQGILAVEGRAEGRAAGILSGISHRETWLCLNLERQVLKLLDAGCHEPIGRLLPAGGRAAGGIWNQRQERPGIQNPSERTAGGGGGAGPPCG